MAVTIAKLRERARVLTETQLTTLIKWAEGRDDTPAKLAKRLGITGAAMEARLRVGFERIGLRDRRALVKHLPVLLDEQQRRAEYRAWARDAAERLGALAGERWNRPHIKPWNGSIRGANAPDREES